LILAVLATTLGALVFSSAPALAAAPQAPVTEAPSPIGATTATFEGKLVPGVPVEKVTYFFDYSAGATAACNESGMRAPAEPFPEAEDNKKVSVPVTGLEGSTTYAVCLVASNPEGETVGTATQQTFTTLASKPLFVSQGSSGVTPFEARLEATVNAENQTTTCEFQYGTDSSLATGTTTTSCEQASIEGGEQGVDLPVSGLTPGPTYYYRVLVTNGTGTTKGTPIEHFTTLTLEKPVVERTPNEVASELESEVASELTPTGAKLEATVNPNYQETACEFQYGTDPTLATSTPVPCEPEHLGTGGGGVGTSVTLTGLQVGKTYYYRVLATNGTGTKEGTIESFTTQGKPFVGTGAAQNMTRTTATLSGTVNPFGAETTYYFAYISEAGYQAALAKGAGGAGGDPYIEGETTAPLTLTATEVVELHGEDVTVPAKHGYETRAVGPLLAGGLLPDTTYRYALVAKNIAGVTIGEPETFTTLAPTPPTVSTGGASGVSQNAATLSGTVSTNSLQTNYGFEIGTEPGNYGPATGIGSIGGAATEEVHVTLGELQPGTTYYYRVTATNADGTIQGQPASFTTPGFPTLISPPASPPLIAVPNIAFPTEEKGSGTTTTTKTLTTKEKLAKALKQCKKDKSKSKKAKCEKVAKKKYPVSESKKKGRKK
jgi:hypothetical protein